MGLLDLFKKKQKNGMSIANYLNGTYPWYSQFGDSIYASDVVQQALFSIVSEIIKLDPTHVRAVKGEDIAIDDDIQSVLDNPNPLMTTTDFIEKVMWNLMLNYNSFIYPIWENNTLVSIYPLQPNYVEFQKDGSGKLYVKMSFANNYECTIPYEDVIHIRYKFSVSEFMGGDKNGQPDNKALLETLKINDTLTKGLAKSLKMQTSVNAAIKMKTMANMEAQLQEIKNFEAKLQNNESGLLPIDISNEFVPIQKQIQLLDPVTLKFIDEKILRNYGVSISIVTGDYTKAQYEAFYQKTLEPIIKKLCQAFTKGLFTKHQAIGFKNKIVFYAKELIFMDTPSKIQLFDILVDSGACYKNELRTAFGMKPLVALEGQLAESSNKTNAENNKEENEEVKEDDDNE